MNPRHNPGPNNDPITSLSQALLQGFEPDSMGLPLCERPILNDFKSTNEKNAANDKHSKNTSFEKNAENDKPLSQLVI